MPDQLDARIRALVREIVDSAPPTPPFENLEAGSAVAVVRQRSRPRTRVLVAIAACVAVALVIGAAFLFSRSDQPAVQSPPASGCAGKAYVNNQGDNTVSTITTATGAVAAPIPVGANPGGLAVTPDGKH